MQPFANICDNRWCVRGIESSAPSIVKCERQPVCVLFTTSANVTVPCLSSASLPQCIRTRRKPSPSVFSVPSRPPFTPSAREDSLARTPRYVQVCGFTERPISRVKVAETAQTKFADVRKNKNRSPVAHSIKFLRRSNVQYNNHLGNVH